MFSDKRNEWLEGIGFVSTVFGGCAILVGLFIWSATRVSDSELSILKKDISALERGIESLNRSVRILNNREEKIND